MLSCVIGDLHVVPYPMEFRYTTRTLSIKLKTGTKHTQQNTFGYMRIVIHDNNLVYTRMCNNNNLNIRTCTFIRSMCSQCTPIY